MNSEIIHFIIFFILSQLKPTLNIENKITGLKKHSCIFISFSLSYAVFHDQLTQGLFFLGSLGHTRVSSNVMQEVIKKNRAPLCLLGLLDNICSKNILQPSALQFIMMKFDLQ